MRVYTLVYNPSSRSVYEVLERCGMARIGIWNSNGFKMTTPNLIFFRTERISAPEFGELFLESGSMPEGITTSVATPRLPLSLRDVDAGSLEAREQPMILRTAGGIQIRLDGDLVCVPHSVEYLRHPREFVESIIALRKEQGYQKMLYAQGMATPSNLAILVYCSIDVLDSLRSILEARYGHFLTSEGPWIYDDFEEIPCKCPACVRGKGYENLLLHNYYSLQRELVMVRESIRKGTLRELVEKRIVNDPWATSVLRHLDLREYQWQELHFPVVGKRLLAYSKDSLFRPDVTRFRRRVKERYSKSPSCKILLLLPCSARKPYSSSKSHKLFRQVIGASGNPNVIHPVVVTSPFGVVPLELELFYPVQHYDIPVTGDWSHDERSILEEDLSAYVERNRYDFVVAHLGAEAPIVKKIVPDTIFTCDGKTTSGRTLKVLHERLTELASQYEIVPQSERRIEEMENIARFLFGRGGEELVKESQIKGIYPDLKIFKGGTQVGMLTGARGMISLTVPGGRILSQKDLYCVEIEDFYPEGNVFAVGVLNASPDIRIGDDVVVRCGAEVRAVGVAQMHCNEMVASDRGEAVRVRHRVRPKAALE